MVIGMTHQSSSMCLSILFISISIWICNVIFGFMIYLSTENFLLRCFMEYQVLAEFVRMLKISRNTRIQAKVLQYLSIMIQNLHSDHAICKKPVFILMHSGYSQLSFFPFCCDMWGMAVFYIPFLSSLRANVANFLDFFSWFPFCFSIINLIINTFIFNLSSIFVFDMAQTIASAMGTLTASSHMSMGSMPVI